MTLQTNNSNTNQTCRLSVQISLTGLSFLVASQQGKPISYSEKQFSAPYTPEELLLELTEALDTEIHLQQTFIDVSLIYTMNTFSLVPISIFDEQKASEYLKFNTKILSNDFISHDTVDNYGMVVVYVPLVNINNYIFDRFGSFQYYHATSLLARQFLTAEKHSTETKVYLHLQKNQFECFIISEGKLQLCNSYTYQTPEDFIYYVLFCFEQLALNPETIKTVVCGAIDDTSNIYEILFNYVRNVSFLDQNMPVIADEKAHQHLLLKTTL